MYLLVVTIFILILDQGSKILVRAIMKEGQSISIINDIFHLTFVKNPGAAFGMLPGKTLFFITITLLTVVLISLFYRKVPKEKLALRLGLGLMLGGAVGNLIDRMRTGMVTDFIDLRVWPVFNLADTAIFVGVVILAIEFLRPESLRYPR